jgi:hypothetical protein
VGGGGEAKGVVGGEDGLELGVSRGVGWSVGGRVVATYPVSNRPLVRTTAKRIVRKNEDQAWKGWIGTTC